MILSIHLHERIGTRAVTPEGSYKPRQAAVSSKRETRTDVTKMALKNVVSRLIAALGDVVGSAGKDEPGDASQAPQSQEKSKLSP